MNIKSIILIAIICISSLFFINMSFAANIKKKCGEVMEGAMTGKEKSLEERLKEYSLDGYFQLIGDNIYTYYNVDGTVPAADADGANKRANADGIYIGNGNNPYINQENNMLYCYDIYGNKLGVGAVPTGLKDRDNYAVSSYVTQKIKNVQNSPIKLSELVKH